MNRAAPTALQLDELLRHPDAERIIAHLTAATPRWLTDQQNAASDDAGRILQLEAALLDTTAEHRAVADVPDWLRLDLLTTITAWTAGRAHTCTHDPHPARPQTVYAAAWRPGLIACGQCIHLVCLQPGSRADRRCDRCGRVTAGLDDGDGIHPIRLQYGPILYAAGACTDCHDPEDHT